MQIGAYITALLRSLSRTSARQGKPHTTFDYNNFFSEAIQQIFSFRHISYTEQCN